MRTNTKYAPFHEQPYYIAYCAHNRRFRLIIVKHHILESRRCPSLPAARLTFCRRVCRQAGRQAGLISFPASTPHVITMRASRSAPYCSLYQFPVSHIAIKVCLLLGLSTPSIIYLPGGPEGSAQCFVVSAALPQHQD